MELSLANLAVPEPLARAFGREAPVELEVGCGKGRFLIRCAEALPGTDFIGIERANRFFQVAVARARRRGLANIRFLRTDALFLIRYVLPSASLHSVHVLFPDPWPKKRHHKRRLLQAGFVRGVERVLKDGGNLNVATDHADYFAWILDVMARARRMQRQESFLLDGRLPPGETGHTNYEIKYRKRGRRIWQATWTRRPRRSAGLPGKEKARETVEGSRA